MGLLPDEDSIRASIGASFGISGNNLFRLLQRMGLDCPGAVQVCSDMEVSPHMLAEEALLPLSEHEVAMRLAEIREDAAAAWTGASAFEGHWSLGGCQAKLALRYEGGQWCECQGAAATTHILKPGVSGLKHQALVEYLSMKTAAAVGLPVARVSYRFFESEPAIIVERYDRRRDENANVMRVHQEDFCQALGVMPSAKYAEQGGPTTPRVFELLCSTGGNARENAYRFILYLFFNYLIGATDAHAKNHSLLLLAVWSIASVLITRTHVRFARFVHSSQCTSPARLASDAASSTGLMIRFMGNFTSFLFRIGALPVHRANTTDRVR